MPGKNMNSIHWRNIHLEIKSQILCTAGKINPRKFMKKGWHIVPRWKLSPPPGLLHPVFSTRHPSPHPGGPRMLDPLAFDANLKEKSEVDIKKTRREEEKEMIIL